MFKPINTLQFSCKKGPSLLVDVEFSRVRFPLSSDNFHNFVDGCPNLEKVKLEDCQGIHLYDILYLLNRTNALKSIDVCFFHDKFVVGSADLDQIKKEPGEWISNVTMKSLIFRNLNEVYDISTATYLLSIFKKCPMLQNVAANFKEMIEEDLFTIIAWREMIANNWQHVQTLTLKYAAWMTNNELIMNALENCCGKGLKELSIEDKVTNNEFIGRICQSFAVLESLELLFDKIEIIQRPVMLQSFQEARFRNSLYTFKAPRSRGFDTLNILNCFPALHTIDLKFTSTLNNVEPFASIPQVLEYTVRFDAGFCSVRPPAEMMDVMKNFINLKKLALHNSTLENTALSRISTLPQLQHLIFHNVYDDSSTIVFYPLLYPNKYPSIQSAPLKEFAYVGISSYNIHYDLEQEHVRTFLQRFVSLERLIIQKKALKVEELVELRQEFRYRTVIVTTY